MSLLPFCKYFGSVLCPSTLRQQPQLVECVTLGCSLFFWPSCNPCICQLCFNPCICQLCFYPCICQLCLLSVTSSVPLFAWPQLSQVLPGETRSDWHSNRKSVSRTKALLLSSPHPPLSHRPAAGKGFWQKRRGPSRISTLYQTFRYK